MSTDLELHVPDELLDVRTGELLPATVENAAELLFAAREMRAKILTLVRDCESVLLADSRRLGTKTIHFAGEPQASPAARNSSGTWTSSPNCSTRTSRCLARRWDELVITSVITRVDARVAAQLASANPVYASVIERAKSYADKPWRVSVK